MITRYYFFAGQTPIINGRNKTFHLMVDVTSFLPCDPNELIKMVRLKKADELGVSRDDILITAFNRI